MKYSDLPDNIRQDIILLIRSQQYRANAYAEKCKVKKMYDSVSPVLLKVAKDVESACLEDNLTDSVIDQIITMDPDRDDIHAALGRVG